MCTRPTSCCASLSAANTGRSGQPMQKPGGRAGSGALELPRRRLRGAGDCRASHATAASTGCSRQVRCTNFDEARRHHLDRVFAGRRAAGPCRAAASGCRAGAAASAISCSMYSGWPSSSTITARLPAQKADDLLGHQRVGDVEHQDRNLAAAEGVGQAELLQRADQRVVQAALHDQPEVAVRAGEVFVEADARRCSAVPPGCARSPFSFSCLKVTGGCASRM